MTRIASNRAAVHAARQRRAALARVKPALDLKHQALLLARAEAARTLARLESAHAARLAGAGAALAMLAGLEGGIMGRVTLAGGPAPGPRIAGVATLSAGSLKASVAPVGLADPPFVADADRVVAAAAEERLAIAAARANLARLDAAARTAAQRLNLVEKVLIPELDSEIRRVSLTLADRRRAAVIAARIAKGHATARGSAS